MFFISHKCFLTFRRNENVFILRQIKNEICSAMKDSNNERERERRREKNECSRKLMTMQLVAIVYFSGNMWKSANLSFEHIRWEWILCMVCIWIAVTRLHHLYVYVVMTPSAPSQQKHDWAQVSRHNYNCFSSIDFAILINDVASFQANEFQFVTSQLGKLKVEMIVQQIFCRQLVRTNVVEMWFRNGFHEMYIVAFIDMLSPLVLCATMILSLFNAHGFRLHSRYFHFQRGERPLFVYCVCFWRFYWIVCASIKALKFDLTSYF